MIGAFRTATLLLVVGCVWLALSALTNTSRVSVWSPGAVALAPVDWWITVRVEPQSDHRRLVVEAIGEPGEYRSSDYTLDGERAAKIRQVWFKVLPAG